MTTHELLAAAVAMLPVNKGWKRLRCPLCLMNTGKADRRGSFSFNTATGGYICYKCGAKGILIGWGEPEDMVDLDPPEPKQAELPEMPKPVGYYPLFKGPAATGSVAAAARRYARRRVPEALWSELEVGATLDGDGIEAGRVIVPVTDGSGRWLGYVGRSWLKNARVPYYYPRGMPRKEILFNPCAVHRETDEPLMVVEGVFDAIHLWPDGVAVLGKPSDAQKTLLLSARRPVVIVLDGDAVDEAEALLGELRARCLYTPIAEGLRLGLVRLPPRIDPDEIPADELRRQARACLEESR